MLDLKDTHIDEECYVFGDGVSVKSFDLSNFCDKPGIAVGVFPRHIDAGAVDLRYWILAEPMFFWPALRKGPYSSRTARRRFQEFFKPQNMTQPGTVPILNLTNFPVGMRRRSRYIFDRLPSNEDDRFCVPDIDYFAGSINASLTLAVYLGFKRAYLVGFDYTHQPATAGHWYEWGRGVPQDFAAYNHEFFEWVTQHIDVVTVVPTPQTTHLTSVSYLELTGSPLTYRENDELLSRDALTTLALWAGYQIFAEFDN